MNPEQPDGRKLTASLLKSRLERSGPQAAFRTRAISGSKDPKLSHSCHLSAAVPPGENSAVPECFSSANSDHDPYFTVSCGPGLSPPLAHHCFYPVTVGISAKLVLQLLIVTFRSNYFFLLKSVKHGAYLLPPSHLLELRYVSLSFSNRSNKHCSVVHAKLSTHASCHSRFNLFSPRLFLPYISILLSLAAESRPLHLSSSVIGLLASFVCNGLTRMPPWKANFSFLPYLFSLP